MAKTRESAKSSKRADEPVAPTPSSKRERKEFLPEVLDRTVIAMPLFKQFAEEWDEQRRPTAKNGRVYHIVIDLNLNYRTKIEGARKAVSKLIQAVIGESKSARVGEMTYSAPPDMQYVFATLDAEAIKRLVRRDSVGKHKFDHAIYHIWPDFPLKRLINKSISTVKADAAHNSFAALGADVVWAVIDSGIDGTHPHFKKHRNLILDLPLAHKDFTPGAPPGPDSALQDRNGHGTHVAGIIAGEVDGKQTPIQATTRYRDENGNTTEATQKLDAIAGMAPRCKLLSLKVLDDGGEGDGTGRASSIMAALQYIQELNGNGRRLLIHGVNLSVGYDFQPEWFACGQSPLCVEVDRLVRSGVVVVVAAGNSGYGFVQSEQEGDTAAGLDLTINDPGNAELAITVGSTHRDMPHTYGVSYFSSKGPTGDGRMKPDLLAPGEKIVSCRSSQMKPSDSNRRKRPAGKRKQPTRIAQYREESGTSMAAPHVSGVIAAFLSIRREYKQHPEEVKRIFLSTATDLNRAPYFQGRGLVDVMRAIQSV